MNTKFKFSRPKKFPKFKFVKIRWNFQKKKIFEKKIKKIFFYSNFVQKFKKIPKKRENFAPNFQIKRIVFPVWQSFLESRARGVQRTCVQAFWPSWDVGYKYTARVCDTRLHIGVSNVLSVCALVCVRTLAKRFGREIWNGNCFLLFFGFSDFLPKRFLLAFLTIDGHRFLAANFWKILFFGFFLEK